MSMKKKSVKGIDEFAINSCRKPSKLAALLEVMLKHYYDAYDRKLTSERIAGELSWSDRTVRYYLNMLRQCGYIDKYNCFTSQDVAKKAGSVVGLVSKGRAKYTQFEGYYATIQVREPLNEGAYDRLKDRVISYLEKSHYVGVTFVIFSPSCFGVYFPRFIEMPGLALCRVLDILSNIIAYLERECGARVGVDYLNIHQFSHNFRLVGKIGITEFSLPNHRLAVEHYSRKDKFRGEYVSIDFSYPAPSLEIRARTHEELMYLLNEFLKREDEEQLKSAQEVEEFCKQKSREYIRLKNKKRNGEGKRNILKQGIQ